MNRLQAILIQLIHLSAEDASFCHAKLQGVLFLAEFDWHQKTAASFTGETFVALEQGPICPAAESALSSLLADGSVSAAERHFNQLRAKSYAASKSAVDRTRQSLSDAEREHLKSVISPFSNWDAKNLLRLAQQYPGWEEAAYGESVPLPEGRLVRPEHIPQFMQEAIHESGVVQ
ncbi:MAG: DUF4065 domain-containing protein [Sumerlaeia bacterium]